MQKGGSVTLIAHPAVLRDLIDEYEALAAGPDTANSAQARQRQDNVTYTLRVSTGLRDIDAALAAAEHQSPGARPLDNSVLSSS
ncbi:DUF5133 domain-containing protein [Streptomyces parvus]|uniref:DUF5133 domain-containing protein n=1 Tax=Streptomyces parvus TaxID=66428 RepID=UPI0033D69510